MNFEDPIVPTPSCPKCGHIEPRSISWLMGQHDFECSGCGVQMRYKDSKFYVAGSDEADDGKTSRIIEE